MSESIDKQLELADVYAQALFELARDQGRIEAVRDELEQLVELGRGDPALRMFFASPSIDADRRAALMEKWFRGRLSDLTLNTLLVANANGRIGLGEALLRCFVLRQEAAAGQIEVRAVSAVELDDGQRHQVRDTAAKLSGRAPLVEFLVEPEILGGLILTIGDVRYDNSVRRHLTDATERLRARGDAGFERSATA